MNFYNQELVNQHFPEALMVPAMRIWSLPKGKENLLQQECESGKYFGQIKKDGFFYEFNRTENYCYLFSRNESTSNGLLTEKIKNVPHIQSALECLPKDTIVVGEIYIPGKTSKDVTKIMGCLPKTAIARQEKEGFVKYFIHDIIAFNGVSMLNMTADKRYDVLLEVWKTFKFSENPHLELAIRYYDNLFTRIGDSLLAGEEGMVLKNKNSVYSPGKKPAWSAIKCKKVDFADVVCIGFEDATEDYKGTELETWQYWKDSQGNKYSSYEEARKQPYSIKPITKPYYHGWKTSVEIGVYNENGEIISVGTVSSGLTDELRAAFAQKPDEFLGKVLMVQCMEIDKNELTFRHARFKEFRIDKNASECTIKDTF